MLDEFVAVGSFSGLGETTATARSGNSRTEFRKESLKEFGRELLYKFLFDSRRSDSERIVAAKSLACSILSLCCLMSGSRESFCAHQAIFGIGVAAFMGTVVDGLVIRRAPQRKITSQLVTPRFPKVPMVMMPRSSPDLLSYSRCVCFCIGCFGQGPLCILEQTNGTRNMVGQLCGKRSHTDCVHGRHDEQFVPADTLFGHCLHGWKFVGVLTYYSATKVTSKTTEALRRLLYPWC